MVKGNKRGSVYAVVLAGGSGTRFWPVSREAMPKQMLSIVGDQTLLQQTLSRIRPKVIPERTYIVTTQFQASEIKRQFILEKGAEEAANLIIEPVGKNTAPAIGYAAVIIEQLDPGAIMLVLPADHHIADEGRFLKAIDAATEVAGKDFLVTLGIRPNRPETGYGYIKIGSGLSEEILRQLRGYDAFYVTAFTEKPDRETAELYLLDGGYFWNSGMFVWRAAAILAEIERHIPKLYKGLDRLRRSLEEGDKGNIKKIYSQLDALSIDYGVMEKSDNVALIPAAIGWSDVGSWQALDEILEKDADGNIVLGDCVAVDTRNSLFWGGERLIAAVGLEDMVVVDTQDALFVCEKDRSQDVRKVVELLKAHGRQECSYPKSGEKSWGSWVILTQGETHQVRRLEIVPGARIDLHKHSKRIEHLILVDGGATVVIDREDRELHPGEGLLVPPGTRHQIENRGESICRLIEVQSGEIIGNEP